MRGLQTVIFDFRKLSDYNGAFMFLFIRKNKMFQTYSRDFLIQQYNKSFTLNFNSGDKWLNSYTVIF